MSRRMAESNIRQSLVDILDLESWGSSPGSCLPALRTCNSWAAQYLCYRQEHACFTCLTTIVLQMREKLELQGSDPSKQNYVSRASNDIVTYDDGDWDAPIWQEGTSFDDDQPRTLSDDYLWIEGDSRQHDESVIC